MWEEKTNQLALAGESEGLKDALMISFPFAYRREMDSVSLIRFRTHDRRKGNWQCIHSLHLPTSGLLQHLMLIDHATFETNF